LKINETEKSLSKNSETWCQEPRKKLGTGRIIEKHLHEKQLIESISILQFRRAYFFFRLTRTKKMGVIMTDTRLIYQQIIENSQDAILFADRDGIINLWNSGAEAIFGYKAEEIQGKNLDLIIPEKLRQRHWEGYQRVMKTGETRYGKELLKVPAMRKDGRTISVEFTLLLVRNRQNEIIGTASIIRDVTERWKQEKELKKKLKFLENQLMSQKHDSG
jgi:PAS domain S-box-containing protein